MAAPFGRNLQAIERTGTGERRGNAERTAGAGGRKADAGSAIRAERGQTGLPERTLRPESDHHLRRRDAARSAAERDFI